MDFTRLLFLMLSIFLVVCGLASGQRFNRRRNQQQQDASRNGGGIRFPEDEGGSRNSGRYPESGGSRNPGRNQEEGNRRISGGNSRQTNLHQGKFPGGFYGGTKW